MSEMVRTVATAICKSRTCEGVSCCQWPAQGGRTDCPVKRGAYDDAARDAIAAMREPTENMLFIGSNEDAGYSDSDLRISWQLMIDEALK